jgi:hypothetical protein
MTLTPDGRAIEKALATLNERGINVVDEEGPRRAGRGAVPRERGWISGLPAVTAAFLSRS